MATVTIPTTPGFKSVRALYRNSTAMSVSKYNFTQQVYSWKGKLKVVEFQLPPMNQTDADNWTEFFDDLNGYENTFNADLSTAYPHETGITSVAMRLMEPEQSWTIDEAMHHGISFVAMEAL
jgi:hypothetical protein